MKHRPSITQRMQPRDSRPASEDSGELPEDRIEIPVEQEIRRRAYRRFEQRGGLPGDACEDWVEAEREILAERAAALAHSHDEP